MRAAEAELERFANEIGSYGLLANGPYRPLEYGASPWHQAECLTAEPGAAGAGPRHARQSPRRGRR